MSLEALAEQYVRLAGEYQRLAERLASNKFLHILFKIGNFRTKVFIVMLMDVRSWSTTELSRFLNVDAGYLVNALRSLEREGLVQRVSHGVWKIKL